MKIKTVWDERPTKKSSSEEITLRALATKQSITKEELPVYGYCKQGTISFELKEKNQDLYMTVWDNTNKRTTHYVCAGDVDIMSMLCEVMGQYSDSMTIDEERWIKRIA
ncbi:MAG: hypothetical protein E7272_07860 [Pseudobutyrivibrio ruminis]|uniref:Uncharacterized protein n=1 Tax=Pseudobutyrivibrio ruminis TaxID=46206 RepID=A0A927U9R9_9FIRM|nr:hypothetical protein [Pseudobutyrivibrio ruminis]